MIVSCPFVLQCVLLWVLPRGFGAVAQGPDLEFWDLSSTRAASHSVPSSLRQSRISVPAGTLHGDRAQPKREEQQLKLLPTKCFSLKTYIEERTNKVHSCEKNSGARSSKSSIPPSEVGRIILLGSHPV